MFVVKYVWEMLHTAPLSGASVTIHDSEKPCSSGNLFNSKNRRQSNPALFSTMGLCPLFLLNISPRKTSFKKTSLRTDAHSYRTFCRRIVSPSCLMFRRGLLLRAYLHGVWEEQRTLCEMGGGRGARSLWTKCVVIKDL